MAAFSLASTLLFFVPAHAYLANQAALLVFFDELLAVLALVTVVFTLLLTGLLLLVPRRIRPRLGVLLLALTLLCWIHAYALVWSYGALDGETIVWADYPGRLLTDGALWLVLSAVLLWFAPRIHRRMPLFCAGILLLQIGSLAVNATHVHNSSHDYSKHYYVDKRPVFEFSAGRNVVLILLDEYQTDIFSEAILPHQEYRAQFPGFTYFPDTTAGFNFTEFAIPSILTGRIYDNSQPRQDFLKSAYLKDSLPAALRQAGIDVHLYPWRSLANESIYYHDELADNILRRPRPLADKLVDVARVVDLGLFRSLPHFAKRFVHNDSSWLVSRWMAGSAKSSATRQPEPIPREVGLGHTLDDLFRMFALGLDHPDTRITIRPGRDVFKFYHLAGLHVPVKMKRDLSYGKFDYTRENFSEQAEAYARIMGAFLRKLKQHGLYDNSLIVMVGDHGSGRSPEMYVKPEFTARTAELDRTAARGDFQRDKARGLPLLLIKRFGAQGEIRTSTLPASVIDIPATIRAELNLPTKPVPALTPYPALHGVSLFNQTEPPEKRTRYYGAMLWTPQQTDYLGTLSLYQIEGHGWNDGSWSFIQRLTPPQ
ncbi:sulfatase-like hydrolase/transferase [Oleiharenicola lentus]|uniref:sulfatase-like hydrolase/transferase n=1 Tax=Oleiharenicola lentus TaxID=2508720 RepID=UPI0013E90AE0|nr:sulfatase-like hydrolase/transferase [Oleiharenicola lentus]